MLGLGDALLLDLGSRSAKAYLAHDEIVETSQISWDLLRESIHESELRATLRSLIEPHLGKRRFVAIGTEAMRRDPTLAEKVAIACRALDISYRTLSHHEEATLIRDALPEFSSHNIVNAGGGSLQIVLSKQNDLKLLTFGISDLNRLFELTNAPKQRNVEECVAWVHERLPMMTGIFIYTGGEKKYLSSLGVPLIHDRCSREDFEFFARKTAALEVYELEKLSPYDPQWMRGAVASNCIVRALLLRSSAQEFIASDLNIAHGLAKSALRSKSK